tara:strand:+ start:598 stop:1059 length:462 start_codon:yes stop_codon:yes gene_type:complete
MDNEIGNRIRLLMHFKKLNATQLADILDVQRSSISHILSGRNKPSLDFVQKIVHEFPEVSFDWLINGSGKLQPTVTNVTHDISTLSKESVTDVTKETPDDEPSQPKTKDSVNQQHNTQTPTIEAQETPTSKEKKVSRVIVFYTDNTFDEYTSN